MCENSTDAMLIRAVLAGDTARFADLVRRHQGPVVRFVRNLVRDAGEAEDVAQEVFLAAYRGLGSFDPERQLRPWLLTIARNRALNTSRRRRHGAGAAGDDLAAPERDLDLVEELERAFARLPFVQRSAFLLAEVEGLEYAEVARIEGVPLGTVRSRIHRARARLRGLLAHLEEHRR